MCNPPVDSPEDKDYTSANGAVRKAISGDAAMPGTLTVTATPIGNLGDLSPRAAAALAEADILACEDTRHTGAMLARLGIRHGRRIAYHDHSPPKTLALLLDALKAGKSVVLVSDAGTPLLSDPGYRLVTACREAAVPVTCIPGPSALLAALGLAGVPTDRFVFAGFLPQAAGRRQRLLQQYRELPMTLVFYESPQRLAACLASMAEIMPGRLAVVARELTKLHEQSWRQEISRLAADFATMEPPKGELVILLGPPPQATTAAVSAAPQDRAIAALIEAAMAGGLSRRDAIRQVTLASGLPRARIYAIAHDGTDEKPA